jgi:hypothetical protein
LRGQHIIADVFGVLSRVSGGTQNRRKIVQTNGAKMALTLLRQAKRLKRNDAAPTCVFVAAPPRPTNRLGGNFDENRQVWNYFCSTVHRFLPLIMKGGPSDSAMNASGAVGNGG